MTAVLTEWVVSASALILVVLLLRGLLGKRISAGLRYALWAVVLVRLLVPVSLFAVTVPQLPKWTPPETMREENIYVLPVDIRPVEESSVHVFEDGTLGDPNSFGYPKLTNDGERVVRYAEKISPLELAGWVWAAGSALFAAVLLAANLRFSIRLRRVRRPLEGCGAPIPVYAASALPSPCLMGLLRPAIYVTEEAAADPVMLRHVLAHELTHYNHLDHLWSILRGAALAVHWWNPLVWLAVLCSRRDGELACDEGALKRLGDSERTAYGETLLALVTAKARPADLLSFATTMTGGKRSLRERIQRIARQPKTLVSAMAVVIAVLTLSALVAFGQAKEETGIPVDPAHDDARLGDAWKTAEVTVDEEGVPHIRYTLPDGGEETWNGSPIPAPKEWADEDLAGRNKTKYLECDPDGYPEIRAKLVSETDGWLVATYGRGVAAADTYVYKTSDRGVTWNEVTMPGTSWHIADVGFLSPDRLIVAQRLFDGAPCFITKDGGETWEEIDLPDVQVLDISYSRGFLTMWIGQYEGGPVTFSMTSMDLGDHWKTASSEESYAQDHPDDTWSPLADLLLDLSEEDIPMFDGDTSELVHCLCVAKRRSRFYTWKSETAAYLGSGADEEDYNIWNIPLANDNTLWLLACEERPSVLMIYETTEEAISAFYDAPELREWILRPESCDDEFDDLEEKRENLSSSAGLDRDKALGTINRDETQAEQYYEAGSLPLFQIAFSKLDEETQGKLLEKIYKDNQIMFWGAAVDLLDENCTLIQRFAEKAYADGRIAYFSTLVMHMSKDTLEVWLNRALDDKKWNFQSVLFSALGRDDEFDELEEKQEKEWADAQTEEYRAVGVTMDGKNYYYQGQLVNIFLDIRPNKSFYTLDMNPAGTVNIKIIRDADNRITGAAYMTEAEVTELLEDMTDPDDEWTDGQEITIPIEIVSVRDGEYIWLGTYDLAEDDRIYYHVSVETGRQLAVGFAKPGQERPNPTYNTITNLRQEDETLEIKSGAIVWDVKSGEYSLFIHTEGGTLTGVSGYVTIVKAK